MPKFILYYCNPRVLIDTFARLDDAITVAHRDRDYCQFILQEDKDGKRTVVWSTARDNPQLMVGYTYTY